MTEPTNGQPDEQATAQGKPKDSRAALGRWGEESAARLLEAAGYRILERNWRARSGELDLVAEAEDTLVFVEVRTRSSASPRFGTPQESVNARKVRQVRETALLYLHMTKQHGRRCRFDVVAVTGRPGGASPQLRHIPNAF